jgi:hypothetical protein
MATPVVRVLGGLVVVGLGVGLGVELGAVVCWGLFGFCGLSGFNGSQKSGLKGEGPPQNGELGSQSLPQPFPRHVGDGVAPDLKVRVGPREGGL